MRGRKGLVPRCTGSLGRAGSRKLDPGATEQGAARVQKRWIISTLYVCFDDHGGLAPIAVMRPGPRCRVPDAAG